MTGTKLTLLASRTTRWASWLELHPESMVLSNDQGRGPSYAYDPFATYAQSLDSGQTPFPTSAEAFADTRLSPSARIIGFDHDGAPHAVPVLGNEQAVVSIGDGSTVVLLDGQGGGDVFAAIVDGQRKIFSINADGVIEDQTGSTWDSAGRATSGPAVGSQLTAQPSRTAFWFAWVSTLGGTPTALYGPDGEL